MLNSFFIHRASLIVVVTAALLLQGCFLAPAIDSFNKLGVTQGDREALLPQHMRRFQDALYWGDPQKALIYVQPAARPKISTQLRTRDDEERIVESRVDQVNFENDSYKASVEVTVKYYKVPFYVVTKRRESQEWDFDVTNGWQLVARNVTPVG